MTDLFDLFFEPSRFHFARLVKDMSPVQTYVKDGKWHAVIHFLGIDKKDVQISLENSEQEGRYRLVAKGKTHIEELDTDFDCYIPFTLLREPKEISWSLNNGLLYLEVEFVTPAKPAVKIFER